MQMENKMGLCLAGGGVKGAAHIGAIKALEENHITFHYLIRQCKYDL